METRHASRWRNNRNAHHSVLGLDLIDCLFNKSLHSGSKVCWALFIIFTQIIGAMIYFFVRCNNHNPVEAVASYYKTVMQWFPTNDFHSS